MEAHGIAEAWETRERVVVAITGRPGGEQLVRRAARIAGRLQGRADRRARRRRPTASRPAPGRPSRTQRRLLDELGGTYREIVGDDVPAALVDFARVREGHPDGHRRQPPQPLARAAPRAVVNAHRPARRGLRRARDRPGRRRPTATPPSPVAGRPSRRPAPWRAHLAAPPARSVSALAVVGLPLLTAVLAATRDHLTLPTDLLLFLVADRRHRARRRRGRGRRRRHRRVAARSTGTSSRRSTRSRSATPRT